MQDGNASWQVPQEILRENTWYEWRVRSTDGSGYSIWAYGTFFANTQNDAPSVPRLISPSSGIQVSSDTPLLMASLASDPDGNSIGYVFTIFDTYRLENIVATGPGVVNHEKHTVFWQVNDTLSEGKLYYWQVKAGDEHGAESVSLPASFIVNTAATTPEPPEVLSPADSSVVTQSSAILQVSVASGNSTLAAIFEIDTVPTFDSEDLVSSLGVAVTDGVASWSVDGLKENTAYYWRTRVSDGTVAGPWSTGRFFVDVVNDPPRLPVVKNPGDMSWVAGTEPTIELLGGTDPDDANVTWLLEVYQDSAMTRKLIERSGGIPVFPLTSADGLEEHTWYFWRAKAVDSQGKESPWIPPASFFTTSMQSEEFCPDLDRDGDVDGLDISRFAASGDLGKIKKMAAAFGSPLICDYDTRAEADFDTDGDADGKDVSLATEPM